MIDYHLHSIIFYVSEQKAKPKKKAAVAKKTKSPGGAKVATGKKVKKSPEAKKEKKLKKEKKKKVKEKGKAKTKSPAGVKAKKAALDANQKKLLKLAGQDQEEEDELDDGGGGEYDPVDELRRKARRSPSYVGRLARILETRYGRYILFLSFITFIYVLFTYSAHCRPKQKREYSPKRIFFFILLNLLTTFGPSYSLWRPSSSSPWLLLRAGLRCPLR